MFPSENLPSSLLIVPETKLLSFSVFTTMFTYGITKLLALSFNKPEIVTDFTWPIDRKAESRNKIKEPVVRNLFIDDTTD